MLDLPRVGFIAHYLNAADNYPSYYLAKESCRRRLSPIAE